MKIEVKTFPNKKGIEDITLGPNYLLYLIIFIAFVIILLAIVYLLKKNILT